MTERSKPTVQPSAVSHTTVGEIVVSVVNDGVFQISFDDVVGVPRPLVESVHVGEFRAAPPWLTINTFLIQTPEGLALVDDGFMPEAGVAFDIDSNAAAVTRKRVLDQVATDRIRVAGIHLDYPSFGRIVRRRVRLPS
jgi:hypothetical protein